MKKSVFIFAFMASVIISAYCGGAISAEPVNIQEIGLDKIDNILISYNSERITLLNSNTDTLILKEYMSNNKERYYAQVTESANELVIKAGQRPVMGNFRARVEIFIPVTKKNISIRTSSGNITGENEYTASSMNFVSSSGNILINSISADSVKFSASSGDIRCEKVNGNAIIETSSGNIIFNTVNGDVSAESSSGRIEIKQISGSLAANSSSGNIDIKQIAGSLTANTSSGGIRSENVNGSIEVRTSSGGVSCSITENAGNVSITTSSGSVVLDIPKNFTFNFLSRTSSGKLNTPFSDKLSSPFSDRDSIQGVIGGENTREPKNVNIRTNSGSISVNWIN